MTPTLKSFSLFTDYDVHLFKAGRHYKLYEKFGSHYLEFEGEKGVYFSVWAPNALSVSVVGNFNSWEEGVHPLEGRWDQSGIWEGFVPNAKLGDLYKYCIETYQKEKILKADPFAINSEMPPYTASVVGTTWYEWEDEDWMKHRYKKNSLQSPVSIYELHLGSWMKNYEGTTSFLEIADKLIGYIKEMGFTHVEFMPVMAHPYEPSWGYQITGYYSVNTRLGRPQDLMYLIEELHKNDIGVFLDWVPAHFPADAHGLHKFDGSHLYEHEDRRKGFHPEWNTWIFNYGRNEVKSFLISNAIFWLDRYHADGLRIDAVTSMIYLDYAREEGQWEPNIKGTNENLEAIEFLKELNTAVYKEFPDVQTIAEESTSYPMMTVPVDKGGLGFGMKWMMGWMHDTLKYFKENPLYRLHYQNKLTFSSMYVFHENYVLPLSHDEVVHGKSPLLYKMSGDEWQKFANLRALYLYMFTHPGAKLLFMGDEFGQTNEWDFSGALDWYLLQYEPHAKLKYYVSQLNHIYTTESALHQNNYKPEGFEWLDADDSKNSVYIYIRKGETAEEDLMVILNLTPQVHYDFRVPLPDNSNWKVFMNSDDKKFWGTGVVTEEIYAEKYAHHGKEYSGMMVMPPLAGLIYKRVKKDKKPKIVDITKTNKIIK